MKRTVRLREEADQDLAAAASWYEQQRAGLGHEFLDEVLATFQRMAENPLSSPGTVISCPHCRKTAMPLWRKCILSPDASVPCVACGKMVSVPWGAIAAAVPIALGVVAAVRLDAPWSVLGLLAGLAAYVLLQRFVVPIVPRDG